MDSGTMTGAPRAAFALREVGARLCYSTTTLRERMRAGTLAFVHFGGRWCPDRCEYAGGRVLVLERDLRVLAGHTVDATPRESLRALWQGVDMLKPAAVGRALGVSSATVRRLIHDRRLAGDTSDGGHHRVRVDSLVDYLLANRSGFRWERS